MNPLHVKGRNFGPYRSFDWEPADGLTAILGENRLGEGVSSNGAGKSTLLEAIRVALFGPDLSWSDYVTLGSDPDNDLCVVELEFEHGGERYRVRRTFSAKGRGKSATDLERLVVSESTYGHGLSETTARAGTWEPLTRERQDETQLLIEKTLGLSLTTYLHSVFASQGAQHFADPALPPRERKAILADALGLDVWAQLLELVRADMSEVRRELVRIDAVLGTADQDLEGRAALISAGDTAARALETLRDAAILARESADKARSRHEASRDAAERWTAAQNRLRIASVAVVAIEEEVEAASAARLEADRISEVLRALEMAAARIPVIEEEITKFRAAEEAQLAASTQARTLARQVTEIEYEADGRRAEGTRMAAAASAAYEEARAIEQGELKVCTHCNQPIADEAAEAAQKKAFDEGALLEQRSSELVTEVLALEARIQALKDERDRITMPPTPSAELWEQRTAELERCRIAASEAQAMRETRAGLYARTEAVVSEAFTARSKAADEELAAAKHALEGMNAPIGAENSEVEATAAAQYAERADQEVRTAEAEMVRIEERIRYLDELAERVRGAVEARKAEEERLALLETLERAYGANGIPALILENSAIPQIEAEAQRVLEALGMPFRIELATQKETKSSTVRDTLDVVVHEPNGPRRYETYSGGEQTRLELSLRIALARLIAQRRGADVGLLALDEPSYLDAAGHAQLANVLRGLTEFRSIVLVSHDESLVDAFDHRVVVVRDEAGSRLEEAA